jgi:hypothetical protein
MNCVTGAPSVALTAAAAAVLHVERLPALQHGMAGTQYLQVSPK